MLGAALFAIGLYGALSRRNAVAILMSIEVMFNGVNVTLLGFSHFIASAVPLLGQVFAIFIITVAAAEAAVGLAIIIAVHRDRADHRGARDRPDEMVREEGIDQGMWGHPTPRQGAAPPGPLLEDTPGPAGSN